MLAPGDVFLVVVAYEATFARMLDACPVRVPDCLDVFEFLRSIDGGVGDDGVIGGRFVEADMTVDVYMLGL